MTFVQLDKRMHEHAAHIRTRIRCLSRLHTLASPLLPFTSKEEEGLELSLVPCRLQLDVHPVLEQAACYGKVAIVKAAAIEALAITAFSASNDYAVVAKCMTGFANLWKTGMRACSPPVTRAWLVLSIFLEVRCACFLIGSHMP